MASNLRDNSSSFEQDNSFIIKNIRKCYEVDEKVSDFFELLQPSDQYVDERYDIVPLPQTSDVAIITNTKPYPQKVEQLALSARNRVYFGAFLNMNCFSCIVDNKLLVWPIDGTGDVTVIDEKAELITAVSCGGKKRDIFDDIVTNVVVVATNRFITIYPVIGSKILSDTPLRVNITSIITAISISDKGLIFAGSDVGDIFLVQYSFSKWIAGKCVVKAQNLTASTLIAYCPKMLRFTHSIAQISICSIDDVSLFIATLDIKSNIRFYLFKDNKLDELSKFEPQPKETKIVALSSVPISDSTFTRFIAFTSKGDRLFFSLAYNQKEEIEIILRQIRNGPSFFSDKELIEASYSLGVSVFMFRKYLVITRSKHSAHIADVNPSEDIAIFNVPSDALIFARGGHIFSNQQFKIFNNEMLWQHLITASPGYLMTTSGINVITFSLPVDNLDRVLNDSHGNFTDSVRNWMQKYHNECESSACALLLAARYPPRERAQALIVLYQFSKLLTRNKEFDIDAIPESCSAFILRLSRLLYPIWNSPIFTQSGKTIQVSRLYSQLPNKFIQNLSTLIDLANDYLHIKISSEQKKEGIKENSILQKFIHYIRLIISTVTFIQIISAQNIQTITETMEILQPPYKERLLNNSFGSDNSDLLNIMSSSSSSFMPPFKKSQMKLFDSLREFASAFFKVTKDLPALAQRLFHECPDFFCEADAKILEAMEAVEKADPNMPTTQLPVLQAACNVFVRYAYRPLKLNEICFYFNQLKFYQGIVDVSLSHAAAIDKVQNGLQWYKSGCKEDDESGKSAFDRRYTCYQHIFDISGQPSAFPLILKANDELFHICFYHYLIEKNDTAILERLLSTETQYLEAYLKEKAPQYLWQYQARHKHYDKAAKLLLNLVKSEQQDADLDTRTSWLLKVIGFARGSGSAIVMNEAQLLYKLASIQTRYNSQVAADTTTSPNTTTNNKMILAQQELFDRCSARGYWDLVINLFACCAVDGLNKKLAISQAWSNLLMEQLWNDPLQLAQKKIMNIVRDIGPANEVLDPTMLVSIFENFKYNKQGPLMWAHDTLIQCHIAQHEILEEYLNIIKSPELNDEQRSDLTYITAIMISNGANVKNRSFEAAKNWFINNARNRTYYEEAFRLINSFANM